VADKIINRETEAVKKIKNKKTKKNTNIAVFTPEVKRGKERFKKIINEVSIKNMLETALATASTLIKSNETENNSANKIKTKTKPILTGIKRKRSRPKKNNFINDLVLLSPAAATVFPVKRGKNRPFKKKN